MTQTSSQVLTDVTGLHPATATLVSSFAQALACKLRMAEIKHGRADDWQAEEWEEECRRQLYLHAMKGDPLDVGAYAAFMWARGWSTTFATDGVDVPADQRLVGEG